MDEFGAPSLGDDCFCAVVAPIVGQIGQYHMRAASAEGLSVGVKFGGTDPRNGKGPSEVSRNGPESLRFSGAGDRDRTGDVQLGNYSNAVTTRD